MVDQPDIVCSVEGCDRGGRITRGFCRMHYQRRLKAGTLPFGDNRPVRGKCDVDGCERPHVARGYCQTHYVRFTKHGDALIVKRGNGKAVSRTIRTSSTEPRRDVDPRTTVVIPIPDGREPVARAMTRGVESVELKLAARKLRPAPGAPMSAVLQSGIGVRSSAGAPWVVIVRVLTEPIEHRAYHRG